MNISLLTNVPALTASRNLEQTLSSGPGSGANLETPAVAQSAEEARTQEVNPPGVGENVDVSA